MSNEIKTGVKSKDILYEKYIKALKNTGYKMNTTNLKKFAYAIVERETELIPLHPDDIQELIIINNKFYKKYLSKI
jgi:ATP phosphoribosyltransferase